MNGQSPSMPHPCNDRDENGHSGCNERSPLGSQAPAKFILTDESCLEDRGPLTDPANVVVLLADFSTAVKTPVILQWPRSVAFNSHLLSVPPIVALPIFVDSARGGSSRECLLILLVLLFLIHSW